MKVLEKTRLQKALLAFAVALALAMGGVLGACAPAQDEAAPQDAGQVAPSAAEEGTLEAPVFDGALVSYLGPEGTYTQEACQLFFGEDAALLPQATVGDAVQLLLNGESDFAVIPQENTIGGPVIDYVDEVLAHDELVIVGEIELPISQNLLVKPGTALADVKIVYSHIQGLVQGEEWLEGNIPQAETVEVASTAEGAKLVAQSDDQGVAAIGSKGAAQVYGLELLAEGIQMSDSNKTRFYVLSTAEPFVGEAERLAFVAYGWAADVPQLLTAAAEQGMKVVALHDRPEKTELGRYAYLVECEGASFEAYRAVRDECAEAFEFRFLGCFDTV